MSDFISSYLFEPSKNFIDEYPFEFMGIILLVIAVIIYIAITNLNLSNEYRTKTVDATITSIKTFYKDTKGNNSKENIVGYTVKFIIENNEEGQLKWNKEEEPKIGNTIKIEYDPNNLKNYDYVSYSSLYYFLWWFFYIFFGIGIFLVSNKIFISIFESFFKNDNTKNIKTDKQK